MKKKTLPSVNTIPPDILEIFGPPPILSSEDEGIYYAMLERFAKDISPSDIIAWLLSKDLVDYRLEIARLRRIKIAVIREGNERRIQTKISSHHCWEELEIENMSKEKDVELRKAENIKPYDENKVGELKAEIEASFQERVATKRRVSEVFYSMWKSDRESDFAISFPNWIDDHEKIDQLLENAERKFLGTLREIDRHIFGFSKALREDLKIIEGEILGPREKCAVSRRGAEPLEVSRAAPRRLMGSFEPVAKRGREHDIASSRNSEPGKRTEKHRPTDRSGQAELKPERVSPRARSYPRS